MKGLRDAGNEVAVFNLDERINFFGAAYVREDSGEYKKCFDYEMAITLAIDGLYSELLKGWPDVLYVVSGFFIPEAVIPMVKARGIKTVVHFTESPYEDDLQLERAATADLVLLNDPTNIERFLEVNPNTHYQPHCYDPTIHLPGPSVPNAVSDFCFVGTGYPSRQAFFEAVDWTGIDIALAGQWPDPDSPLVKYLAHDLEKCSDNATDTRDLYRSCKASANLYRRESNEPELSDGWSIGPREVELAAMGTFFLRESRGEGDELFPNLPIFSTPEDFEVQLRWWLDHPVERAVRAEEARDAIQDRTFGNAARRVMQLLEQ